MCNTDDELLDFMEEEVIITLIIEKSDPLRYNVRPADGDKEDIQEMEHT